MNMKRVFLMSVVAVLAVLCYGQSKVEYHEGQTRIVEPIQDVYVRPLVADLEIMKQTITTYFPTWEFKDKKLVDLTLLDLENAKKNAAYTAAARDGADVIVGATFEVRNHMEKDKNGKEVSSEYGVDVIVRGYPAKYVNWHKLGEQQDDTKWIQQLFDGQRVRSSTPVADKDKSKALK